MHPTPLKIQKTVLSLPSPQSGGQIREIYKYNVSCGNILLIIVSKMLHEKKHVQLPTASRLHAFDF